MGYLNKATITVDAILTNRGREILAEGGRGELDITKFAVGDDEIDYGLYNTAHPEGTDYYGAIIENMPILEATPDEQQIMRYKLVSLDSLGAPFVNADTGIIIVPTIDGFDNVSLTQNTTKASSLTSIAPQIKTNPSYAEGYTLIVADATFFEIYSAGVEGVGGGTLLNTLETINANGSITLKFDNTENTANPRAYFSFRSKGVAGTTTATLFGNKTGATKTITITVA